MVDQIDPAARQRLVRDIVRLAPQRLAEARPNGLPLPHGFLPLANGMPCRANAGLAARFLTQISALLATTLGFGGLRTRLTNRIKGFSLGHAVAARAWKSHARVAGRCRSSTPRYRVLAACSSRANSGSRQRGDLFGLDLAGVERWIREKAPKKRASMEGSL
jgi:hypothetical protein